MEKKSPNVKSTKFKNTAFWPKLPNLHSICTEATDWIPLCQHPDYILTLQ